MENHCAGAKGKPLCTIIIHQTVKKKKKLTFRKWNVKRNWFDDCNSIWWWIIHVTHQ